MNITALSSSAPMSMPNRFKYNGKELNEEFDLNWYSYGAREYDPQLGRFFTQDRYAEKYYDMNPYQYAANDPIRNIDINGDSVWVTYDKKKDLFTMNFTGKVLNLSNDETLDVKAFQDKFSAAWKAAGVDNVELNINFTEAESIDDIESGDHVIAQVDNVEGGKGEARLGGMVAFVESSGLFRDADAVVQTAVHEAAHLLGIKDAFATKDAADDMPSNMMSYPVGTFGTFGVNDVRKRFNSNQVGLAKEKAVRDHNMKTNYYLNRGSNIQLTRGGYSFRSTPSRPWRGRKRAGSTIIRSN
jgi:RHS repeat-associated protein